jgi:hypothetical protein
VAGRGEIPGGVLLAKTAVEKKDKRTARMDKEITIGFSFGMRSSNPGDEIEPVYSIVRLIFNPPLTSIIRDSFVF